MILRNLLFFIAILLLTGWVLTIFVWKHEGHMVHILLVLAVISLIIGLTRKRETDV